MPRQVTVQLSEEATRAINVRPEDLPGKVREAVALLWFEDDPLSQGRAATALGLQRGEFFDQLAALRISPVRITAKDLEDEFRCV